ncbi:hypothetical protein [Acidithiobacillus thiooxidans]|nr:hypothetical protein [Acidithiobacillus thiooxidans]
MDFNEKTSIKPLGLPTGPREDYKPDRLVYRRGETLTTRTESPSMSALLNGSYTDRVRTAVQSGHRTTSAIVSSTKIPRDKVIKVLSYLIAQGQIRDQIPPSEIPEGDRYVVDCRAFNVSHHSATVDAAPLEGTKSQAEQDEANTVDSEPSTIMDTPMPRDTPIKATESIESHPVKEDRSDSLDASLVADPRMAFDALVQEWKAMSTEVSDIQSRALAVQNRLENAMTAFPMLYDVIASAEQAKKSQAALTSITDTLRTLNISI